MLLSKKKKKSDNIGAINSTSLKNLNNYGKIEEEWSVILKSDLIFCQTIEFSLLSC